MTTVASLEEDGPEDSATTTEASAEKNKHEDFNNNNGGANDASKRLKMTTEVAESQKRAQWIGNVNGVSIYLAITSLKVTLSHLLVAVLF